MVAVESLKVSDMKNKAVGFCKPEQVQRQHFISSCYIYMGLYLVDEKVGRVGLGVLERVVSARKRSTGFKLF